MSDPEMRKAIYISKYVFSIRDNFRAHNFLRKIQLTIDSGERDILANNSKYCSLKFRKTGIGLGPEGGG